MKNVKINGIVSEVYFADEEGNVYSRQNDGSLRKLTPHITHDGYRRVRLQRDVPRKMYRMCRVIAETFHEKPEGCDVVNHLNNRRDDDRVSNLEWTDNAGNQRQRFEGTLGTKAKEVAQYDNGVLVDTYASPIIAEKETGVARQNISKVCRGLRKSAGGFQWRYTE